MNAPAIVHLLKRKACCPTSGARPKADPIGRGLRRMRLHKGYSLSKVARAAGVSVGFLSALERGQMTRFRGYFAPDGALLSNEYSVAVRSVECQSRAGAARRTAKCSMPVPACAWNCWPGAIR